MKEDEIVIEEVIRMTESGNLSPALMIEASKAIELRRISVALWKLVDEGLITHEE